MQVSSSLHQKPHSFGPQLLIITGVSPGGDVEVVVVVEVLVVVDVADVDFFVVVAHFIFALVSFPFPFDTVMLRVIKHRSLVLIS